jgi:MFS transporter, putative metabolite:H+ symporter
MAGVQAGEPISSRTVKLTVLVAALGYFVDIYDLLLFLVVRRASLLGIGVPADQLLGTGVLLFNMQMAGMLIGGIVWGVLGDKRGRLSVLFGSIILYSLANIANGFVYDVGTYAVVRFIAGFGLAGELGAGITLVSELMSRTNRGYGTAIVAAVGICGAVVGALVGDLVHWRTAYFIGGGLGLALLVLRLGVVESGMFRQARQTTTRRGSILALLWPLARLRRYLAVIAVGLPIWFVVGVLIGLAPELGKALGTTPAPAASRAVLFCYAGLAVGDLASGVASQLLRSRKKIVIAFIGLTAAMMAVYFLAGGRSLTAFYAICTGLGLATGYWAVFVTIASEQFGTNLRATATTTAPNFVRGAVVPITSGFLALKTPLGLLPAAAVVGAVTLVIAVVALVSLDETFGKDLDYLEVV